jgi:hypothetical protein
MENDEKPFGEKKIGEDELLDFEFDELANDSGGSEDGESVEDDGIIELVDVVEKGELPPISETEEIERYLDKEESPGDLQADETEAEEPSEDEMGGEDLVDSEVLEPIEDIELDLMEAEDTLAISDVEEEGKEEDQHLGLDLESALETLDSSQDSDGAVEPPPTVASEREDITELEESDLLLEETEEEMKTLPLESEMQLPDEDLSAIPEQEEGTLEGHISEEEPGFQAATALSEEKMEAIVARAVGEAVRNSVEIIVERVARETMTAVAEKLITEAINALRESLDSNSD